MRAKTANIGDKFGRWTVIEDSFIKNEETRVLCQCECGTIREKVLSSLMRATNKSFSCGCYISDKNSTHKRSSTRIYLIYNLMRQRCYNKKSKAYPKYGGCGIKICDEWLNDFLVFEKWAIENGYQDGLTIDRKDNELGYSPENCRWATRGQNQMNRRVLKNTNLKYKGVFPSGKKFAAKICINYKQYYIGTFETEEEAALAYNKKAIELHGEFACLNVIPLCQADN